MEYFPGVLVLFIPLAKFSVYVAISDSSYLTFDTLIDNKWVIGEMFKFKSWKLPTYYHVTVHFLQRFVDPEESPVLSTAFVFCYEGQMSNGQRQGCRSRLQESRV